jgi:hypothetical protein
MNQDFDLLKLILIIVLFLEEKKMMKMFDMLVLFDFHLFELNMLMMNEMMMIMVDLMEE